MKVPLLDLKKQFAVVEEEVMSAIKGVVDSQRFILGPVVETFEREIAAYCGCAYAVGVSSGSDALLVSLMTSGIQRGDLVITTPYTFFATVGAITRVGAEPVFVDIEKDTYNMDAQKLGETISGLEAEKRARLKAIIPVHLFGQCMDMEPVLRIASTHDLVVIEDAAQAIGAEYEFADGTVKRAGTMGQYGCLSFFPSKNLGAFGDGGMVITNHVKIYEDLKIMRAHGSKPKYYHKLVGGNFRLDALQAAVLSAKLRHLDKWTEKRRRNAKQYRALFQQAELEGISLPKDLQKRHIYNQFVIGVAEGRDELRAHLAEMGVGSEVYYPVPIHLQECYAHLGHKRGEFPVSELAAQKSLAVPIYPELESEQITYVVEMIREFCENA